MNYTDTQPLVQCSLDTMTIAPEELTIPSELVKSGVLYFMSGMPSFRQMAPLKLVVKQNASGKEDNGHSHIWKYYRITGRHVRKDEYAPSRVAP